MEKPFSIYQFNDYRNFLSQLIKRAPNHGRGIQTRLAKAIRCQPPFITHVLAGRNEFSNEHAIATADFFNLTDAETEFFLTLVSYNRAGTKKLKDFFKGRLEDQTDKNKVLSKRVEIEESLRIEDQSQYYSHWIYSAIHIALTVPALQTPDALASYFSVPLKLVNKVLKFLNEKGLAERNGARYLGQGTILHLKKGSPTLLNHHSNWRQKSIDMCVNEKTNDLHYSGVMSCSKKDILILNEIIAQAISEITKNVKNSPEEVLIGFCADFFEF